MALSHVESIGLTATPACTEGGVDLISIVLISVSPSGCAMSLALWHIVLFVRLRQFGLVYYISP